MQRVTELEAKIETEGPKKTVIDSIGQDAKANTMMAEVEQWKTELDDIVASECYLCGSIMINSIDTPFFDPEDANLYESWKI